MAAASAASQVVVRFSASKVALAVGLHEFGDLTEEVVEVRARVSQSTTVVHCHHWSPDVRCWLRQYVYQDRPELLERDAERLGLTIVSPDDELLALVDRSGPSVSRELRSVLSWTRDRAAPARVATAEALMANVASLLADAARSKRITGDEAVEAVRLMNEKIRQSVGTRNESLALKVSRKVSMVCWVLAMD